ncbi:hypothetical protein N7488_006329 [Penicillium malachiteum]|nr:hypothetical protein N7488_006329 [Penicillium malachiteum]
MSLMLISPGEFLHTARIDFTHLANRQDSSLHAFAIICEAKHLRLHIANRQLQEQKLRLKSFCDLLPTLRQKDFKNRGMVKGDLEELRNACNIPNFPPPGYAASTLKQTEQVDLPPYPRCEVPVSDQGLSSIEGNPQKLFRPLEFYDFPLGSPTEIATPTTISPLASIRPTDFDRTSPGRSQDGKLARLIEALRDSTRETIIEALKQTNHSDLLVSRQNMDQKLPAGLERLVRRMLDDFRDDMSENLHDEIFARLRNATPESLGDSNTQEIIRNQVSDEIETLRTDILAQIEAEIEDGRIELQDVANGYWKEFEDDALRLKDTIEDEIKAKIKDEIKAKIKNEIEDEFKNEIKAKIKNEIEDEFKNEIKAKIKNEIEDEFKENVARFIPSKPGSYSHTRYLSI